MHLKLLQKVKVKTKSKENCDVIGNKIRDKSKKATRTLPRNSLETVTNEAEYIFLDKQEKKKSGRY